MLLPRLARDPLRNSYSGSPYVLIRHISGLLFALGDSVDTHHHHTPPPALHQPGASSSAFHPHLLCLATPFSRKLLAANRSLFTWDCLGAGPWGPWRGLESKWPFRVVSRSADKTCPHALLSSSHQIHTAPAKNKLLGKAILSWGGSWRGWTAQGWPRTAQYPFFLKGD